MIKLIIFDLDNTLYPTFEQVNQCRKAAILEMKKHGLPGTEKELTTELNQIVKELGSNSQEHFNTLVKRLMKELNEREQTYIIGKGVTAYSLKKAKSMKLYKDTIKTLNKLENKHYKLAILTDGIPVKQYDKVNRLKLDKHFGTNIWITPDKTDNKAIKEILKTFNTKPSQALLVGDRKKSDIQAAKNAGIKSAQILKGPYINEEGPEPDKKIKNLTELLSILTQI